jgi:hypothetical protein
MPIRPSQSRDVVAKLGRWADMRVRVALADTEVGDDGRTRWKDGTDETLGVFGAVWDRKLKRWAKPEEHKLPPRADPLRLHRGQEEAGRWLVDWLRRWGRNDWRDYKRVWSAMMIGGRRSGKTHLCVVVLLLFAVMKARAITWVISPTIDTGNEIDEALTDLLPAKWKVERYQATNGRSTRYLLPNGSQIMLRSGINPARLKAGKADVCLYNEAQLQKHDGYVKLRGGAVDRGGLVLLAANPPDQPIGQWVEEHYHRATRGELDGVAFQLDPLRNPWIKVEALLALKKEVDDKTFNREVRGLFEPIGNLVMYTWRTAWRTTSTRRPTWSTARARSPSGCSAPAAAPTSCWAWTSRSSRTSRRRSTSSSAIRPRHPTTSSTGSSTSSWLRKVARTDSSTRSKTRWPGRLAASRWRSARGASSTPPLVAQW